MSKLALVRDKYLNLWDIGNYYGVVDKGVELLLCGTNEVDWDSIMEYYPKARFVNYTNLWEVLEHDPNVIDVPDAFYPFSQYFTDRFDKTVVVGWENLPGKNLFSQKALKCLKDAWKCTARSSMAREELMFNGVPNEKINTIYGAIDIDFFKPGDSIERGNHVLFVGRVTQEKGFLDLLWALHNTGIKLKVAGVTEPPLQYQKWLSQLNVDIEFLGFLSRDELVKQYQKAGCLCVPSLPLINDTDPYGSWLEQFGQVFIEAMACGCPVVSTRSGAIPEVVDSGGILVNPRDWPDLRKTIKQIIKNGYGKTASEMGRTVAEFYYDQNKIAKQIVEWYEL